MLDRRLERRRSIRVKPAVPPGSRRRKELPRLQKHAIGRCSRWRLSFDEPYVTNSF